jgi:hypothetical protein
MIRVLRVIEYRYTDAQAMIEDRERWTISHSTPFMKMNSVVLEPTWEEPVEAYDGTAPQA